MNIDKIVIYNPATDALDEVTGLRTKSALMIRLKELIHEYQGNELEDGGVIIPSFFIITNENNNKFVIKYDVISEKEGFLSLTKIEANGKEKTKDLNIATFTDIEHYLNDITLHSYSELSDMHFPKPSLSSLIFHYALGGFCTYASIGFFACIFTDYVLYEEHFSQYFWLYGIATVMCFVLFIKQSLTQEVKDRRKMMGMSLTKLVFSFIVTCPLLGFGAVQATTAAVHYATAHEQTLTLTLTQVSTNYHGGKSGCNGAVYAKEFSGSICLESRAYWMVAEPGMKITATGLASVFGMELKALEF